jgi:hypothetical protein
MVTSTPSPNCRRQSGARTSISKPKPRLLFASNCIAPGFVASVTCAVSANVSTRRAAPTFFADIVIIATSANLTPRRHARTPSEREERPLGDRERSGGGATVAWTVALSGGSLAQQGKIGRASARGRAREAHYTQSDFIQLQYNFDLLHPW